MGERACSKATHARLGKADLSPDLPQCQPASVRQHEDASLERSEIAQRVCHKRPALVASPGRGSQFGHVADAIERDFDVGRTRGRRRSAVFAGPLRLPECAARAASQRITLAKRIQDLPADAPRGVCAERGASVPAIPACSLHEADQAPGDEILAVRAAAAWIDGSRGDRPRELKVRDDAVISDWKSRFGQAHLPCGADRSEAHHRCQ